MLLIKFSFYGGDADITYDGFFVLTPELWEAFKELAKIQVPEFIHVDCDDKLPVCLDEDYEKFMHGFTATEITKEEFAVLDRLFRREFEDKDGILSHGRDAIWTWVFDTEEALERLGGYSGELKVKP